MNLSTKQKQTHRCEQTCDCQEGGAWEREGSLGLADAVSYTEWITNKILLYSTGNY